MTIIVNSVMARSNSWTLRWLSQPENTTMRNMMGVPMALSNCTEDYSLVSQSRNFSEKSEPLELEKYCDSAYFSLEQTTNQFNAQWQRACQTSNQTN
jgi:hypothetical protein